MKPKHIPTGNSKEEIEVRKNIIKDFYYKWKRNNPTQKLYNLDLKDYINIRYISIVETVEHSTILYNCYKDIKNPIGFKISFPIGLLFLPQNATFVFPL